jgi:hypothetical protein
MRDSCPRPKIDMAKIPVGGGIAGLLFAAGTIVIFLLGIPALRWMFAAAILSGCVLALILHFIRHKNKFVFCIFSDSKR